MASSLDGFQIWLDKCTEDRSVLAPCILYKDHIYCPLSKELKVHLGSSTSFYHHNKPWLFTRDCEKPKITGALCDWEGIWALIWFLWTLLSWSMTMVHTTESHQLRSRAFPSFPFFPAFFCSVPEWTSCPTMVFATWKSLLQLMLPLDQSSINLCIIQRTRQSPTKHVFRHIFKRQSCKNLTNAWWYCRSQKRFTSWRAEGLYIAKFYITWRGWPAHHSQWAG